MAKPQDRVPVRYVAQLQAGDRFEFQRLHVSTEPGVFEVTNTEDEGMLEYRVTFDVPAETLGGESEQLIIDHRLPEASEGPQDAVDGIVQDASQLTIAAAIVEAVAAEDSRVTDRISSLERSVESLSRVVKWSRRVGHAGLGFILTMGVAEHAFGDGTVTFGEDVSTAEGLLIPASVFLVYGYGYAAALHLSPGLEFRDDLTEERNNAGLLNSTVTALDNI